VPKRAGSVVKVFGSASDFPEPIAKSQAAPLTAERNLKKQDPWQVGPVETRLANPFESALWACHTSLIVCEIDDRDERRGMISIWRKRS
jgi:hypothetical protein